MNQLLSEILAKADPSQVAGLSRFFKTEPGQYGEGDKFLGIKVPYAPHYASLRHREIPARRKECYFESRVGLISELDLKARPFPIHLHSILHRGRSSLYCQIPAELHPILL